MSSRQPLNNTRHRSLRWQRFADYHFAAGQNLAALAAAEVPQAALALPLAFVEQGGVWTLCAILGLLPGENLYVGPAGQWVAAYIPATFRAHPFQLGWGASGDATLCVDEGSSLIGEGEGEPFFDETGDLAPTVRQVWTFLQGTAQSLVALEHANHVLAEAGVLEPWPIKIQSDGGERTLTGLHRVSEVALNGLEGAAFLRLRDAGVLEVAYAQLLSMWNLPDLGKLAQARARTQTQASADAARQANADPMVHLPNDSTIDWDWSKVGR